MNIHLLAFFCFNTKNIVADQLNLLNQFSSIFAKNYPTESTHIKNSCKLNFHPISEKLGFS